MNEVYDLNTHPADARRFYLNQINTSDDAWLSESEWTAVADLLHEIHAEDAIVMGFDGSKRRNKGVADATALIGCRVSDGHLFPIHVWEQPEGPSQDAWEVPKAEVDATVADAFKTYNVIGFYADPAKWESYIAKWEALYGAKLKVKASAAHPIEWWMTGGRSGLIVRALNVFYTAVMEKTLSHNGSAVLMRHALNARRRATRSGIQIAKDNPDSPRKIDAVVASVLAYQCRLDALSSGAYATQTQKRSKKIRGR
jgi:hypothetical protein